MYISLICHTGSHMYIYGQVFTSHDNCDQIWEKPAPRHTTARHTFQHYTIAVHVD